MSDKNSKIIDFLSNEYLSDYVEILGLVVSITEYYPQQADSQIRNAMTHLARAAIAEDLDIIETELGKAKSHIERAKRDCLKLAIIEKKKHVFDHIKSIYFAKGGLPEDIMIKRLEVAEEQRIAFVNETKGVDITPQLEKVLTQLLNLEVEIIKFDKIAFQPSRVVYIASIFVKSINKILSLLGMAVLVYIISKQIVPSLFG
jgi:hypothetical protein